MSLFANSLKSVGITVTLAATSYLLSAVTARLFDSDITSQMFVLWTAVNIGLLVFQYPIEPYGPRLQQWLDEHNYMDIGLSPTIGSYLLLTAFGISLMTVAVTFILNNDLLGAAIGVSFFIFCHSLFLWRRAQLFAVGNLRPIVMGSLATFGTALVLFSALLILDLNNEAFVYLVIAISYFVGFLLLVHRNSTWFRPSKNMARASLQAISSRHFRGDVSSLMLTNAISLLLLNGGVLIVSVLGIDSVSLVTYSALISLSLIPFTLMNSITLPVLLEGMELVKNNKWSDFWSLYVRTCAGFILFTGVVATVFMFIGNRLLQFYVGSQYGTTKQSIFFTTIAAGLAITTSVPRILLVATGRVNALNYAMLISIVVYGLVLFMPIDPQHVVVLASIVGSLPLLVLGTLKLRRLLNPTIKTTS